MIRNMYIPTVRYKDAEHEGVMDLYSGLLRSGVIFLNDEINDDSANLLIAQLLYLEKEGNKDVTLYLNSPGGSVISGLSIYDAIRSLKMKLNIVCYGYAMSMGAILLASGPKGRRAAYKNSVIMFHQPSIKNMGGKFSEIKVTYEYMKDNYDRINQIIISHTKITAEDIANMHEDMYLTADQALEKGVIDFIEPIDEGVVKS